MLALSLFVNVCLLVYVAATVVVMRAGAVDATKANDAIRAALTRKKGTP